MSVPPWPALALVILLLAAAAPAALAAQEESPLTLGELTIDPVAPGVDTLCKLTVAVRNAGARPASYLAFEVRLNTESLEVYDKQLFLQEIPPQSEEPVRLYNFWTTETGRSRPADGKLRVEVRLVEAQWVEITTDEEEVETWTPRGEVPGLPQTADRVLQLPNR